MVLLKSWSSREDENAVENKIKQIFHSLDRRSPSKPGRVKRKDAIHALHIILGTSESQQGEESMKQICPESWTAEELSYVQFRDLVQVAGALTALRNIDAVHLERRWAAISDPESNYTLDFPTKSDAELYEVVITDEEECERERIRIVKRDHGEGLKQEVNRIILRQEHSNGQPVHGKQSKRAAATDSSSAVAGPAFEDLSTLSKAWDVAKSLTAGGLAGAVAKTVIAPLDRTKIIFQTTQKQFSMRGAGREMCRIIEQDGITGLWRGHLATLSRVMPYAGIQFVSFDFFKQSLLLENEKRLTPARRLLAGSLAGATSVICTYPLDLMRARMAVQHASHGGMVHNFRVILDSEGVTGLYRGLAPTLLGILPYAGLAFGTFETLKIMVCQHYEIESVSAGQRFYCGVMAGFIAQSLTYPIDIVRRRMQTDGVHATASPREQIKSRKYHGIWQTLTHVASREGVSRGLFKGLSMNWVKGPIAQGISFTTFDLLKRKFEIRQHVVK